MAERTVTARILHQTVSPLSLEKVMESYYPHIQLGRVRTPVYPITNILQNLGIEIHPWTVTARREGSARNDRYSEHFVAKTLLLKALMNDENWSTPTVGAVSAAILEDTLPYAQEKSVWGLRKSAGITPCLTELYRVGPNVIASLFAGMRIDGAYIAQAVPEAWDKLREALYRYTEDYRSQPPSVQKSPETIADIEAARNPRELYAAIHKPDREVHGFRRLGAILPYELDYWHWLIASGTFALYPHTPFSMEVLKAQSTVFAVNETLIPKIMKDTGIRMNSNVPTLRFRLIQADMPKSFGQTTFANL